MIIYSSQKIIDQNKNATSFNELYQCLPFSGRAGRLPAGGHIQTKIGISKLPIPTNTGGLLLKIENTTPIICNLQT
jgi:hypothetical protein